MKNCFLRLCICFVLFLGSSAVSVNVYGVNASVKGTLPSDLDECSGLDFTGGASFWTHVDGYGDNFLYKISNTGVKTRSVEVTNATNHDWEEITHDIGRNYMFIGDFGNNDCDRTDLKVYRITYPSNFSGSTVTADEIEFSYPDQTDFPSDWLNFDVEAFFHYDGELFLLTKADGNAIGYTKLYSLPDQPGIYQATLIDSFQTDDRITSADISPDGKTMVMISNNRIHVFTDFPGTNFFAGDHQRLKITGDWTQKEAVSFYSNKMIYLTDEDNGAGNFLYSVDLTSYLPANIPTAITETPEQDYSVYPNPANDFVTISSRTKGLNTSVKIFDLTGKQVLEAAFAPASSQLKLNTGMLPEGVYFYRIFSEAREVRTSRLVISR